jgi:hypothetical protein
MSGTMHQRWTKQVEHMVQTAQGRVESGNAIEMVGGLLVTFFLLFLVMSSATSLLVPAPLPRRKP